MLSAPLTWRHVAQCALVHLRDVCLVHIHLERQTKVTNLYKDARGQRGLRVKGLRSVWYKEEGARAR